MADRVAELMARMPTREYDAVLPKGAKDEFWEKGFTEVARITTDEEVEWLRDVYDALFEGEAGAYVVRDVMTRIDEQRGDRVGQIIRPENYWPQLRETQFYKNGQKLSSQILDLAPAEMEAWGHMVRKSPNDTEALCFHQDEAFWDPHLDYLALGCWMPLDPATIESGCMDMVPGSHKLGIVPHKLGQDDPAVSYIEVVNPVSNTVPRPIPVGGASFHHCRTIHGSGPNMTGRVRRAFINEWQKIPVKRAAPKDHPWWFARYEAMRKLAPEKIMQVVED